MFNLPVEVLYLIFPLLVQRDKLECMTVCRQWHDIILHHSLFRVIYVDKKERFNQLIDRVKKDPSLGTKVERLSLKLQLKKTFDERVLFELFPKLRHFVTSNENYSRHETASLKLPQQSHPWREYIEKMVEHESDVHTRALLHSGMCKHLTHITVTRQGNSEVRELFKGLAKAPGLKKLEISKYFITCHDLEVLHENTPSLNSIMLTDNYLGGSSLPQNIKPATLVTSFQYQLNNRSTYEERNTYFQYVCAKYTHLEELGFEVKAMSHILEDGDESATDQKESITKIMKTLAPRLKTLTVYLNLDESDEFYDGFDFDMLDECGCRIETMCLIPQIPISILESLSRTNLAKYTQKLTIHELILPSGDPSPLDCLARFTSLKELSLYHACKRISLAKFRYNLPAIMDVLTSNQLETLLLHNMQVCCNMFGSTHIFPSIKNLNFSSVHFVGDADVMMSQSFPNLKNLTLQNCFRKRKTFQLPRTDLSHLEISFVTVKGPLRVLVTTLDNNQQRLYSTSRKPFYVSSDREGHAWDLFSLPSISSQPYDEPSDTPFIKIVCKSLRNFTLLKSPVNVFL